MKDLKHTPGPWHAVEYAGFWMIQNEEGYAPTQLLDEEYFPNAKANAKLAAAAPDLLEALIEMTELFNRIHGKAAIGAPIRFKAKQAIKKATS